MPTITEIYEQRLLQQQAALAKKIKAYYQGAISEIQSVLSIIKFKGTKFNIKDYPLLNKKVESIVAKMQTSIYAVTVNGIKESWDLSNQKNNLFADKRLAKSKVPKKLKQIIYDPNKNTLDKFIKRADKGLNLSDRVWNTLDPFKKELEQSIGLGLGAGKPAIEIAKDIKKYLNEPDKLFRRVRGEDGKLHLSNAARNYHPGQGVYRSSYKNALRVSRTETNIAYRTADHERWQNMAFITGFEVKLSAQHPKYDICDKLVGQYPKDFKFTGWHPQCLCYQVPKIMNDKEFEKLEDQVLAGEPIGIQSKDAVIDTPNGFKQYLKDNKERIDGWKNKPYWMKDNPIAVSDAFTGIEKIPIAGISLPDIENRIRSQKFESAAIFKDGKQLLFKNGEQSSVSFTDAEVTLMRDAILTHNHPGSKSFSREDVSMFVRQEMAEVRAVSQNFDYSLKNGTFNRKNSDVKDVLNWYSHFDHEVRNEFEDLLADKKISLDFANAEHHHKIMLKLAERFGFKYNRIKIEK